MADFEYSFHDGFYSIFPNSDAARETVNAMIREHGSNKLFLPEFEAFRLQARRAGYTVRKFKPTIISDDALAHYLDAGTTPVPLTDLVGICKLPEGTDSVSYVRKMRDSAAH